MPDEHRDIKPYVNPVRGLPWKSITDVKDRDLHDELCGNGKLGNGSCGYVFTSTLQVTDNSVLALPQVMLRFPGNPINCFPWDQLLSVKWYILVEFGEYAMNKGSYDELWVIFNGYLVSLWNKIRKGSLTSSSSSQLLSREYEVAQPLLFLFAFPFLNHLLRILSFFIFIFILIFPLVFIGIFISVCIFVLRTFAFQFAFHVSSTLSLLFAYVSLCILIW